MRPDQERVRNLLIDTVTLLCKNSVQFQDELHVEGLLGVSVDKKDVFFVHISKEFSNSPSDGATVTQTNIDSQDDSHPAENSRGSDDTHQKDSISDNQELGKISIKTEAVDRPEDVEECLIVEDPHIKLEGKASPAQVVAGQRRAGKRTSHSDNQHYVEDSSLHSAYGLGSSGSFDNSQFGGIGEPPSKRRADGQGDDYLQEDGDDTGGTPWPSLAGTAGFDPSQAFQQDSDNSQISMDGSQPGCSSWSTPGRGPSDSVTADSATVREVYTEQPWLYPDQGLVSKSGPSHYSDRNHHPCPICGRAWSRSNDLKRHMRTHTREKPFPCPYCGRCFSLKYNMETHVKKKHKYLKKEQTI